MATNVTLPDMGEGIEDVTINRWLVEEGDTIEEGAPLVDVATDKVDTEVPSPAGGTVLKLNFGAGELVPVSEVIAVIGEAGETVADGTEADQTGAAEREPDEDIEADETAGMPEPETDAPIEAEMQRAAQVTSQVDEQDDEAVKATPVARRMAAEEGVPLGAVTGTGPGGQIRKSDVQGYLDQQQPGAKKTAEPSKGLEGDLANVAPLSVRRVAADYDVDLREVANGKPFSALTRYDVLRYVAERDNLDHLPTEPGYPSRAEAAPAQPQAEPAAQPTTKPQAEAQPKTQAKPAPKGEPDLKSTEEFVPHSRMRTIIARNTSESAFTAPHVTTMWDVNMSAVLAHRKAHKAEYAKSGVNLTVTAYLLKAMIAGVRAVPAANATWREDGLIIRRHVNLGMAVALPPDQYGVGGLIVPVIKNADDLSLMGLARQINELAEKARNNQLSADDLQGGTITLSNYGTSGSRFQTPIIVQPQVGILGVGAIEKRPVVVSQGHPLEANMGDYMTFAPMTTLGFSYDHRVLDGASADAFCAAVKDALENWRDE